MTKFNNQKECILSISKSMTSFKTHSNKFHPVTVFSEIHIILFLAIKLHAIPKELELATKMLVVNYD